MANLKSCFGCGSMISTNAKFCPHCGAVKKKSRTGCLVGLIVFIVFFCGMCSKMGRGYPAGEDPAIRRQSETKATPDISTQFEELKLRDDVEKFSVSKNKITVVYKKDLPDHVELEMRNFAARGSKFADHARFTAECSVAQAEKQILHSETRENREVLWIKFAENKFASDAQKENQRLKEAERQKQLFAERRRKSQRFQTFWRNHCIEYSGECRPVVAFFKKRMNDPKSYEHVKTVIYLPNDEEFFPVTMTCRGKNSFGATVTNTHEFLVSPDGKFVKLIK